MKKLFTLLSVSLLATTAFADTVIDIVDTNPQGFVASNTDRSTLTVTGEVLQTTCKLDVGSLNKSVKLDTIPMTELDTANKVAGVKDFSIAITACPSSHLLGNQVFIKFDGGSNHVADNGNLNNIFSSGTATQNVQVQLLNADGQAINLKTQANNTQAYTLGNVPANSVFNFKAQYFATGSATAGKFESSIPFEISYK